MWRLLRRCYVKMVFKIPLQIRKILYRESDRRPTMHTLSLFDMMSTMVGDYAILQLRPEKGIGRDAQIDRHELAFVKFLKANYGVGDYSIVICRGGFKGFKLFWRGNIEKDRFIRHSGSISPYLLTHSPVKAWHDLNTNLNDNKEQEINGN